MITKLLKKTNLHIAIPIFVIFYLPLVFAGKWFVRMDYPEPFELLMSKIGVLSFITAACACHRTSKVFNPMRNPAYLQFLALSPWTHKKPLPNGSITLSYLDLPVLLVASMLAYINFPFFAFIPAITFFLIYVVVMAFSLANVEQYEVLTPLVFILPLSAYPFRSFNFAMFILVVMYLIVLFGFERWKINFPQNTIYWKDDLVENLTKTSIRQKKVGYPYNLLSEVKISSSMSLAESITVSLLVTWYFHVAISLGEVDLESESLLPFLVLAGFFFGLFRFIKYAGNFRSPMSLFGRIVNRHFIIPRYDVIWISPICTFLSMLLLPCILSYVGIGKLMSYEIAIFIGILCILSLPPSYKKWILTGHHRMTRLAKKQRTG